MSTNQWAIIGAIVAAAISGASTAIANGAIPLGDIGPVAVTLGTLLVMVASLVFPRINQKPPVE